MGGTPCKATPNSNKAITIAVLGLDNAGKTTTTRVLEKSPVDSVSPTVGFSQTEITHKNEKIKLIDLGGAQTFREAWRHYYDDAYGFVYVLDSSEEERLPENREVLKRLLQEEKVKGKPILILANKQDKAEALNKAAILEDLKIERLVNENQTLCRVELCTAAALSRNGKNPKMDETIRHGFDWLIKTIYESYDTLHRRVEADVQKRKEKEQKEKRERMERIKKLREEREKEGEEEEAENEEDTIKNGFVPINQAVKNAEKNSSEKPSKDKPSHKSLKSNLTDENTKIPPKPAPRSISHNRIPNSDDNIDDHDRPRRHSTDRLSQRKESPLPANPDGNERVNSPDSQTGNRPLPGKKKKVIGPGRQRSQGDNLPPVAPSAASRREDIPQHKGPPVGTPRPQPLVAQWAITSPTPQYPVEKLTTITSDNENDNDEKSKSTKKTSTSNQRHSNGHLSRESSERQKSSSRLSNHTDENDESDGMSRRTSSKRRHNRNHDDDSDRKEQPSMRKSTSNHNSTHRSHSKSNGFVDDDAE
ncbi:unnamed protein product [Adineta ricciae]|uniref:ADP-ribosylation factor-like protein 13B n=1 Tax=Adineta ricciae TaxID=249248 RepID=A0A814H924_ADIRI|nr:unnamed protein product [Adineta ricciae]